MFAKRKTATNVLVYETQLLTYPAIFRYDCSFEDSQVANDVIVTKVHLRNISKRVDTDLRL